MTAYEECLSHTSTPDSPWYVVPADDKKTARLIVSQILLDTFHGLHMAYPTPSEQRKHELREIGRKLRA
jgi:hypothetical protein